MGNYTPGPWTQRGDCVESFGGEQVAQCTSATQYQVEQRHANARLIASAPELLEALVMARSEIRAQRAYAFTGSRIPYENDPRYITSKMVERKIDAAIAKAEGRKE